MSYSNLSIDQAPSIGTPARFFVTAPLFGMLAIIGLLIQGPDILQQRWLPQTLAITHLLTLGFISMTMMGALFQLLPVLAGSRIYRAETTARLVHALVTAGVLLFTLGLYLSHSIILRGGLLLLLPGLLLFLISISVSLLQAHSSHASITGMRLAVISLWISATMGLMLALGHGFDAIPLLRQYTDLHLAWAGIGWVGTMIISIAYQVIPMFQVTREYPVLVRRYFTWLIFLLLLLWSVLRFTGSNRDWLESGLLVMLCLLFVAFIGITLQLLMQRRKRRADASLYFWLFGMLMLGASLLLLLYSTFNQAAMAMPMAILFVIGFVLSIINGMLYKILPFLVWLHLHQQGALPRKADREIPSMNDIIAPKQTVYQLYLHMAGVGCLLLALVYPWIFFYPALLLLFASWLLLELLLLRALRLYRQHLQ
ncbi:MAG TPA: hypothetical protein VIN71_04975 [Pseudomonadales bacterium]